LLSGINLSKNYDRVPIEAYDSPERFERSSGQHTIVRKEEPHLILPEFGKFQYVIQRHDTIL
jgi:hypothetical protein